MGDSDIQVIKTKIEYITQFIEEDRRKYSEHLATAQMYRDRVAALEKDTKTYNDNFKIHCEWDKWLFGFLISLNVCIFGVILKVFFNA